MIGRGRVLPREAAAEAVPVRWGLELGHQPGNQLKAGRIAPQVVVDASLQAEQLLERAREAASSLVAAAERSAADLKLRAESEARAEAAAKLAAHWLLLATHEAQADERALDRSVELARLLAERLLGAALSVAPEQVVLLARQALTEARGARQLSIVAHPEDARLLERELPSLGVGLESVRVAADATRSRGSLRLETDVGVLDADLAPQLDRLARRLRETLAHGK